MPNKERQFVRDANGSGRFAKRAAETSGSPRTDEPEGHLVTVAGADTPTDQHKKNTRERKDDAKPKKRKRIALGEAMRKQGLDEHMLAEMYAGVVKRLGTKAANEGSEKLLVDVLRECGRQLEMQTPGASERSTKVELIHNVPRPKREAQKTDPEPQDTE